jgi:epoxyqueuosine reductase QueG
MDKDFFTRTLKDFVNTAAGNHVEKEIALSRECEGMRMIDEPLAGFAGAADPLFTELKKPGIVGSHFCLPSGWLDGAKTVVSFFFPFTEEVKSANRANLDWPADAWLHARIEGQVFVFDICLHMKEILEAEGFSCVVPSMDPRFKSGNPAVTDSSLQDFYTSNWSERHVAHVCGLGTFGLSRGLITARGIAGRFGSLITDAVFEPDIRPYTAYDEYCTRCGACAHNCPAKAITLAEGKKHYPCWAFVDTTQKKHDPRYGCGKCQIRVPCENGIPKTGNDLKRA